MSKDDFGKEKKELQKPYNEEVEDVLILRDVLGSKSQALTELNFSNV